MPTGRVKFYDSDKGFGFIAADDGTEVFLHVSALPKGVVVKQGTKLEFGIADGKKGPQALSARIIANNAREAAMLRMSVDELAVVVEDLITLLDGVGETLKRGHYPDDKTAYKLAVVLHKVADDFDALT